MNKGKEMQKITKQQIYELFQDLTIVDALSYGSPGSDSTYNKIHFDHVAGDVHTGYDEDSIDNLRFIVWQCGDLFIRINVNISSYGERKLQNWSFVTPKEKIVFEYS